MITDITGQIERKFAYIDNIISAHTFNTRRRIKAMWNIRSIV